VEGTKPPAFLVVGHLNKAHGTKGEVFVWPLTDRPDEVFVAGAPLQLGDEQGRRASVPATELTIVSVRPFRRGFLLHLEGVTDRNQAEYLTGSYVLTPFRDPDRAPDEYYYHELLRLEVVGPDGVVLGRVTEVYELMPAHMLEVNGPGGSRLVPLSAVFVRHVDLAAGRITLDPPEGFLEL